MALSDNLVAYWKFDESSGNAADSSGNGNTLTNNNGATYNSGLIGNQVNLARASSQTLSRANGSLVGLAFTGDFSFSYWYKPASNPSGTDIYGHICRRNLGGQYSYRMYYNNNSGSPKFVCLIGNGSSTESGYDFSQTFSSGTRYHIVITWDNTNKVFKLYVNASLVGTSTTLSTAVGAGSADFVIGDNVSDTSVGNRVDGAFDEMGAWSKTLSGSEVTQLYNSGAGVQYPFGTNVSVNPSALGISFSLPSPTIATATGVTVLPSSQSITFSLGESLTSEGPDLAGAGQDDNAVGTVAWSNPANITTASATYASWIEGSSATSHYLLANNLGFSVPIEATVLGIEVTIRRGKGSHLSAYNDSSIRLFISGSPTGDNKSVGEAWAVSFQERTYGGEADLWGVALSPSDVNAANFGVGLSIVGSGAIDARVEWIKISVRYSVGATVITTSNVVIAPNALSVSFSLPSPSLIADAIISPAAQAITFSLPIPDILIADTTLTPEPLSISFSLPAATVVTTASATAEPSALSFSFSLPSAAAITDTLVQPAALSFSFSLPLATVLGNGNETVSPASLLFSFSLPQPALIADQIISVSPLSIAFSLPSPTISLPQDVFPSPLGITFTLPSPHIFGDAVVQPSPLGISFSIPEFTAGVSVLLTPEPLSMTFVCPTPTLLFDYALSPSPLAVAFTLPALRRVGSLWENESRQNVSIGNQDRSTTSLTNEARSSITWTNEQKSTL